MLNAGVAHAGCSGLFTCGAYSALFISADSIRYLTSSVVRHVMPIVSSIEIGLHPIFLHLCRILAAVFFNNLHFWRIFAATYLHIPNICCIFAAAKVFMTLPLPPTALKSGKMYRPSLTDLKAQSVAQTY